MNTSATDSTPLGVLVAARKLIEKPEAWIQHDSARNANGKWVAPRHESAVCWCSSGAVARVAPQGWPGYASHAFRMLSGAMDGTSVPTFNDTHTHTEVLEAFDRAIALARAA